MSKTSLKIRPSDIESFLKSVYLYSDGTPVTSATLLIKNELSR